MAGRLFYPAPKPTPPPASWLRPSTWPSLRGVPWLWSAHYARGLGKFLFFRLKGRLYDALEQVGGGGTQAVAASGGCLPASPTLSAVPTNPHCSWQPALPRPSRLHLQCLVAFAWVAGNSQRMDVHPGAPLAAGGAAPAQLPLVVFSHGLGGNRFL